MYTYITTEEWINHQFAGTVGIYILYELHIYVNIYIDIYMIFISTYISLVLCRNICKTRRYMSAYIMCKICMSHLCVYTSTVQQFICALDIDKRSLCLIGQRYVFETHNNLSATVVYTLVYSSLTINEAIHFSQNLSAYLSTSRWTVIL